MADLGTHGAKSNVVILDACRNDPFERSDRYRPGTRGSGSRGLQVLKAGDFSNMFIAYATKPGDVALDGDGRNGIYTKHLLAALQQPGLTIEKVFKQVRKNVRLETESNQIPWTSSGLEDELFLGSKLQPTFTAFKPDPLNEFRNAINQTDWIKTSDLALNQRIEQYQKTLTLYGALSTEEFYQATTQRLKRLEKINAQLGNMTVAYDDTEENAASSATNRAKYNVWNDFVVKWSGGYDYTNEDDIILKRARSYSREYQTAWQSDMSASQALSKKRTEKAQQDAVIARAEAAKAKAASKRSSASEPETEAYELPDFGGF
jgi:hypothetical protein